jgi:23S rRNA pseudouridine2605 synthase
LPPPRPSHEPQRIAKLLARAGIASRREIERMIEERRIAINGTPIDKPATLLTSLHGVTVDGRPVKAAAPARLFRYHKPTGLLTAERDPQGRPTIYDRLPQDLPRVIPVGRLDLNTEGLLLLTTDGELKRQLELPSTGVERAYRARVFGEISQDRLESLIEGIEIEGVRYGSIDANLERRTGRNSWLEMKLTEGKNREVRRVLEHLGLRVSRLIRIAYGPFLLGDLPAGAVDEVRQHDLIAFRKWLASPSAAPMAPIAGSRLQRTGSERKGSTGGRRDTPREAATAPRAKPGPGRPGRPQPEAEKGAGGKRAERPQRWRNATASGVDKDDRRREADTAPQRPRGAKPGSGRPGRVQPGAEFGAGEKTAAKPQRWRNAKPGSPKASENAPEADRKREAAGRRDATARPRRAQDSRSGRARPGKPPSGGRPRGPARP